MNMKKAFDQTVRDLKREVNKKVLKVPNIEQKILDATSNETWGPHGSLLADIAQATRNHQEYQIIMSIIWKRMNDTGKNWRHVYKALIVLDYLVAHGSERVIDDIKEHAYQISTLSDFQYIDSSGRDQGSNVRKKSQSLVTLVNDKERVQEVRQKSAANKEKYRNAPPGGVYRSTCSSTGGYGGTYYDNDRYESNSGGRYEERNGYGREDDRYGGPGDTPGRDGDRYSKDSNERFGRDNDREDENRRGHGNNEYVEGSRRRSFDRERDRPYDDDGSMSSRNVEGHTQDERQLERKPSSQQFGAPPSYEDAVRDAQSNVPEDRNGGSMSPAVPTVSSPSAPRLSSSSVHINVGQDNGANDAPLPPPKEFNGFDGFDPRGSVSSAPAPPPATNTTEMDLFGSDPIYSLALVPTTSATTTPEVDLTANSGFETSNFVAMPSTSDVFSQPSDNNPFGNPFGDAPFKAVLEETAVVQQVNAVPVTSFQPVVSAAAADPLPPAPAMSFDFGGALGDLTYTPNETVGQQEVFASSTPFTAEIPIMQGTIDNSPSFPPQMAAANFPLSQPPQHVAPNPPMYQSNFVSQPFMQASTNVPSAFPSQTGMPTYNPSQPPQQALPPANLPNSQSSFLPESGLVGQVGSQPVPLALGASQPFTATPHTVPSSMNFSSQSAPSASLLTETTVSSLQIVPTQPVKKFEPKSTVWADTLNRGLVDLNISGPKANPHSDLGIDFDSINRKDRREEKRTATAPAISTVTMGKAMGTGSGIGRAGASVIATPANPMGMGRGIGMGMGGGGAPGLGVGGGFGMPNNQPMGMGMGVNMGMPMGMNQGMPQMRPPAGMPSGGAPNYGAGYNPMNTGYGPQQPFGGYR